MLIHVDKLHLVTVNEESSWISDEQILTLYRLNEKRLLHLSVIDSSVNLKAGNSLM